MRLCLLLTVVVSITSEPAFAAGCHVYSIWHFKNAQRCGGNSPPVVRGIAKRMTVPVELPPSPGPSFDIPLTDPDPLTMALKAQLQ